MQGSQVPRLSFTCHVLAACRPSILQQTQFHYLNLKKAEATNPQHLAFSFLRNKDLAWRINGGRSHTCSPGSSAPSTPARRRHQSGLSPERAFFHSGSFLITPSLESQHILIQQI